MTRRNNWRYADESLTSVITCEQTNGRAVGHKREPGVMNKTEKRYSEHLEQRRQVKELQWWTFEGMTFRIASHCYYTPDFDVLMANNELQCIDVKGTQHKSNKAGDIYATDYTEDDARVKLAACAALYPISFWIVFEDAGNWTLKEVKL